MQATATDGTLFELSHPDFDRSRVLREASEAGQNTCLLHLDAQDFAMWQSGQLADSPDHALTLMKVLDWSYRHLACRCMACALACCWKGHLHLRTSIDQDLRDHHIVSMIGA